MIIGGDIVLTNFNACELGVQCSARKGAVLIACDSTKPNSIYFKRQIDVDDKYIIKLPISPKYISVEILGDNSLITDIQILPLVKSDIFVDEKTRNYLQFIQKFIIKAGYLSIGLYTDLKSQFVLSYEQIIKDRGIKAHTPARIGVSNNVIQLSKSKFKKMTIPERMMILLHEYSHNYLNVDEDCELEADKWAEMIYFALGYPVMASVDTFHNVLSDSELSEKRMEQVYNIAKDYAI